MGIFKQLATRSAECNPAVFQHVAAIRDFKGIKDILLDQQDGGSALVDFCNDFKDGAHQNRRQAQRRFIQHHECGQRHQAAAHGQHLLLAAAQGPGFLVEAFL